VGKIFPIKAERRQESFVDDEGLGQSVVFSWSLYIDRWSRMPDESMGRADMGQNLPPSRIGIESVMIDEVS
jgi:hypothetical protein